jgi:hypothetical protein
LALLRLWRALWGVWLLALAWGMILLGLLLGHQMLGVPAHRQLLVRLALYVLGALGILWLAAVALGCTVVGVFALTLAFTRRG